MAERENSELTSHFSTDYWRKSLLAGAPGSERGSRGLAIPSSHPARDGEAGVRAGLGTCSLAAPCVSWAVAVLRAWPSRT